MESLERATSPEVFAWMVRKARLADGTRPGLPFVAPGEIDALVAVHRARSPRATVDGPTGGPRSLWDVAASALHRDLGGCSLTVLGRGLSLGREAARGLYLVHRWALDHDVGYRGIVVELSRRLLHGVDSPFAGDLRPTSDAIEHEPIQ
jgi:hypothetical protein